MTTVRIQLGRIFSSLAVRNFRLFFIGQSVSLSGVWVQRIAQAWLVLELTGSGTAVGLVTALQFLPVLLLAPLGGLFADRSDKRLILIVTQAGSALSAALLGVVTLTGVVELWMVYALALGLGLAGSLGNPARQTFVLEMVGPSQLTNALSLNSTLMNAARIVGPAIAGVLIATVGLAWCFLFNAVTYLAVIAALLALDVGELEKTPSQPRRKRQLREGLAYVRHTPSVMMPILLMAVAGTFAFEYQVVLPLLARFTFEGDAQTFALMTSAMGVGAVAGGLVTAARQAHGHRLLLQIATLFGATQVLASLAPGLITAVVLLVGLGAVSLAFIAVGNSTLQLSSVPEMRGRVMGLWAVAFLGSTPIGGPLMGWLGENLSPRWALGIGGLTILVAAGLAARRFLPRIEANGLSGTTTER